ncbi:hypothetical protein M6B38_302785 [Iris pallida]|uniref:Ribosomal protein L32 n=1 Tax=Iris pallida TaxID=29817 RepID=A0AAX6HNY0_IRIPA|nr:hypothetical protein M6B38_302785 [Iris pallida]
MKRKEKNSNNSVFKKINVTNLQVSKTCSYFV